MSQTDYILGQSFIESFMVDTCVVTRLPGGIKTDVLDPNTGNLVTPTGSTHTQYDGKCVVKKPRIESVPQTLAGQYSSYALYKILIPVSATDVRFGDILTVTASRDAALLAHKMRIVDVWAATHDIYCALWAIDLTSGVRTQD